MSRWLLATLAAVAAIGGLPAHASTAQVGASARPVVVAVMEPGGFNVLHEEFRTADGRDPVLPAGMPRSTVIHLPQAGNFASRMAKVESGPLGAMVPGRLYRIADSRIIGVIAGPGDLSPVDIFNNPAHGTGVAGALAGLHHGTDPSVLVVLVTSVDREAWEWVARQPWIDFVEASYASLNGSATIGAGYFPSLQQLTCDEGPSVAKLVGEGRVVFTAQGNTEQIGEIEPPSGLPGAIHVGGVDGSGASWLPGDASPDPMITASSPTRPYDLGELYSFPSLSATSLTDTAWFGGTSGATPRLTGDAALLVSFARSLLRTPNTDELGPHLATLGTGGHRPSAGPLSDGKLDASELATLLYATAQPASSVPDNFALEGYGAYNRGAIANAERILAGAAAEPGRTADDEQKHVVDAERSVVFGSYRCG